MTQPTPPAFDANAVPCNLGGAIVPGPNGQPLVELVLQSGLTQYRIAVDVDTAERMAEAIPQVLAAVIAEVRRAMTGLIVATPDALRTLPPPTPTNGNRRHG